MNILQMENVVWQESPHGYWYNTLLDDNVGEKIVTLQTYLVEAGFNPPIVLCHEHRNHFGEQWVFYTPQDQNFSPGPPIKATIE